MKRTEQGWSIYNPDVGLYIGWYLTRASAIADHVGSLNSNISRLVCGRTLSDDQKREWERCKMRGDRAVKVTVSCEVPE